MATHVLVQDDAVDIDFTGLDRALTLRGHVRLPMGVVAGAHLASRDELRRDIRLRLGGTHVPGVVTAGTFSSKERSGADQLWNVHRDGEVLLVETKLDHPWRVVLQHPDRSRLAWLIAERIDR